MKKILLILSIVLLASCAIKKKGADGKDRTSTEKIEITATDIKASMEYLASDELGGRATGSNGIEKAAIFIENYFKTNGIKPYFLKEKDTFSNGSESIVGHSRIYRDTFKLGDLIGYNLVGMIEGNDPRLKNEFIILGGHYDHIGKGKEVNGDSIANGANDDASGTIAAMEFGRYFSKSKSNKRSILITLYSAEEMGLKGSAHLAKRLKEESLDVYTMINFEMIGVPRAVDKSVAYMSGYNRSNFAPILNKYAGGEVVGFFPKAKEFQLFFRSDNFPFFKEFSIPAHAISTFDFTNFEYYHHVDDEADKMDYDHMANFINKMIPALEGMMNAPTKEVVLSDE